MKDINCPNCTKMMFQVAKEAKKEEILKRFEFFDQIQCKNCKNWYKVKDLVPSNI